MDRSKIDFAVGDLGNVLGQMASEIEAAQRRMDIFHNRFDVLEGAKATVVEEAERKRTCSDCKVSSCPVWWELMVRKCARQANSPNYDPHIANQIGKRCKDYK